MIRTLAVHLHLYYLKQLPSILKYLKNLNGVDYDLFVSLTQKNEMVEKRIKEFHPNAFIWCVPNRGYDVGPFIDFLHHIDLNQYKYVLKIHTKAEKSQNSTYLNGYRLDNKLWRQILLDGLLKDKIQVHDNLEIMKKNKKIGMISSVFCVTEDTKVFSYLLSDINAEMKRMGFKTVKKLSFSAGTMFLVRSNLLRPFYLYSVNDFTPTNGEIRDGTLAHIVERLFGAVIEQQGFEVRGVYHGYYTKQFLWLSLKHFLYQKKQTSSGSTLVKICRIPVYHKRKR